MTSYTYASESYVAMYGSSKNHIFSYTDAANPDGSLAYVMTGDTGKTVSGTHPALSTLPVDSDFGYQQSTIHVDSQAQSVTVDMLNTGVVWTFGYSNGNFVASAPGYPTITIPASALAVNVESVSQRSVAAFGTHVHPDILKSCIAAWIAAVALATAAAAAPAAVVLALCAGDGPFAVVTCAGAQVVATGILTAAGKEVHKIVTQGCG